MICDNKIVQNFDYQNSRKLEINAKLPMFKF